MRQLIKDYQQAIDMIVFPNAKINIGLNILRRRSDGYHDISTVMVPVPWRDILEIVPAKSNETTLTVTGRPVDCTTEKNLVMKAFRRVQREIPVPEMDIYLHKVIPDGAGLGGGSADAAFTITALNTMLSLGLSEEKMAEMASEIGADCAFFVYNRPMLAEGKGEVLTEIDIDLSGVEALIMKPTTYISTAEAYAGVTPETPPEHISQAIASPHKEWQRRIRNDFEISLRSNHPEIEAIKEKMQAKGAFYASLSGSGSAVYGLFERDILSDNSADINIEGDMLRCIIG